MEKNKINIENIPAIIWGDSSEKVYLYVHGQGGSKDEAEQFAKIANKFSYQVLSIDLPEHGERIEEVDSLNPWDVLPELDLVIGYMKLNWEHISLFANSIGAWFSMQGMNNEILERAIFVSPIIDMENLISNMMKYENISQNELKEKQNITTSSGQSLSWRYFKYAAENPISKWDIPTYILFAKDDIFTGNELMKAFATKFTCNLTVIEQAEHWFHTPSQLEVLHSWMEQCLRDSLDNKIISYEIIHLPKDQWKDTIIPIEYTTNDYYDVIITDLDKGFRIDIEKKKLDNAITHTPEEYNFPDRLYKGYWEDEFAWGIVEQGKLIAAIETAPEKWSNRLRITELWVSPEHQRKGIGHELIELAKERLKRERRRALILETQSCNANAIDFYIHEGFSIMGMDTCCYSNDDIDRKEVRFEFAWFPKKNPKLKISDIEIRSEKESDWYDVELMTQQAFWNKHHLGCDEHYLVHKLRQSEDYIPELSKVAVKNGEIIGYIMYSKAKIIDGETSHEVLTFGPLCVRPDWQGGNVGELLMSETMKLASEKGYKGIVIFGEPDYYPRIGFKTCDKFEMTTADGKNFDAFMAYELSPDSMKDIKGKYYYSEVFDNLPSEEVEEYNKKFPKLKKMKFPGQWD